MQIDVFTSTEEPTITICWHEKGPPYDSIDHFPSSWFVEDGEKKGLHHLVRNKDGGFAIAQCNVLVERDIAYIDYGGDYARVNQSSGMELGTLRLQFSDAGRTKVVAAMWRHDLNGLFKPQKVTIRFVDEDFDTAEGEPVLSQHLKRERNPLLSLARKMEELCATGRVVCAACGFDPATLYGEAGLLLNEVHHEIPLSTGPQNTRGSDLTILCPNCHRMIHKIRPTPTVEQFREGLNLPRILHKGSC